MVLKICVTLHGYHLQQPSAKLGLFCLQYSIYLDGECLVVGRFLVGHLVVVGSGEWTEIGGDWKEVD